MRKLISITMVLGLMFLIIGCMPAVQPQTAKQKIAYAWATLTGLNKSAEALISAGAISVEDAEEYEGQALEARAVLRVADLYLKTGQETEALDSWQTVNVLLLHMNEYLLAKEEARK